MKTDISKEERVLLNEKVNEVLNGAEQAVFTGTTISPYNLISFLACDKKMEEVYADQNGSDFWRGFKFNNVSYCVWYDAETFQLTLSRE